jgi:hypothetical protein
VRCDVGAGCTGDAGVLGALIAVMDHAVGFALLQRHVQRHKHQVGRHLFADGPARDAPTPDIQHDGPATTGFESTR